MTSAVMALKATAWCAALAATTCLLAGLGGAIWDKADFLNQFAPIWSLAGFAAVAVLCAISKRRRPVAALALVLLAASAVLEGPELAHRFADGRASPPTGVRIVQFNVWKGNLTPARAAAWVLDQRPDFVVLEEAADIGGDVERLLGAQYPYRITCRGRGFCSTMILSRIPPEAGEGLARGDAENRKALSAGWARYRLGGRSITILAVHLARPWPWGRQAQDRRLLLDEVRKLPDQNLIVVGDFNTTPWTFAGKRQDVAMGMRRITRALFSWPFYLQPKIRVYPVFPFLPIDQAYLRPGLLPVAVRGGPNLGSDHRPVVIDLTWADLRQRRRGK